MGLIDWHSHVWLPHHLGPEWGPQLDARYPEIPVTTAGTYDHHRAALDECGAEHAVVIALTSRHFELEIPNEFVAEYVATDPQRLTGFACVDPNDPQAVPKLRDAVENMGLRGLKLAPPYQSFHPHSPEAWAIYEAAAELGIVLMFHQGAVFAARGPLEHANPILLDKVAAAFPQMRIIVAHMGQPWYAETVALMSKHPNVFSDLSARFHRPWQLHNALLAARDYKVTHKLLFGTDFPLFTPAQCVEQFRGINESTEGRLPPIDDALIDAIINDRPLSLVGL
jgi:predicted TIM-barrel fold metal-dependent hydrolase